MCWFGVGSIWRVVMVGLRWVELVWLATWVFRVGVGSGLYPPNTRGLF